MLGSFRSSVSHPATWSIGRADHTDQGSIFLWKKTIANWGYFVSDLFLSRKENIVNGEVYLSDL